MPYIGKSPATGQFKKLDGLTTSATDTYALTYNTAAFKPATAEQLVVSVNGVTQAPVDSYSINGSDIIFSQALTASDTIDYIIALGEVGNSIVPTDGSVDTTKLSSTISRGGPANIRVNPNSLTIATTIASGENALVAGPFTLSADLVINGTFTVV